MHIVNNRDALKEIVRKFSEFKFQERFYWNYDPQGILSNIRVKCKLTPFFHVSRLEIEKYANQMEWIETTLIDPSTNTEKERQIDNSQAITVTELTETSNKRTRNEEGYTAETIAENKFKIIYNKKAKMTDAKKEKIIEIYENEDQANNNDQKTDDEATLIVNETLK